MKNITSGQHKDRKQLVAFCGIIIIAQILNIKIESVAGPEILGFKLESIKIENIRRAIFTVLSYLSAVHFFNIKEYIKAINLNIKKEHREVTQFNEYLIEKTGAVTEKEIKIKTKITNELREDAIKIIEADPRRPTSEHIYFIWTPLILVIWTFIILQPKPFQ